MAATTHNFDMQTAESDERGTDHEDAADACSANATNDGNADRVPSTFPTISCLQPYPVSVHDPSGTCPRSTSS